MTVSAAANATSDAITGRSMQAVRPIPPPLYAFTAALSGLTQGFVTVTLGYVASRQGFAGPAIAALIGLRLLPETWRLFLGPIVDLSLNARLWFLISAACASLCVLLFALIPLQPRSTALLSLLALVLGIFANLCIVAQAASIAVTTGPDVRGRIAGWSQAGNLGGIGLGGGLGLWLATHFGIGIAALAIAACCLACAWPMLVIRTPRPGRALPLLRVIKDLGLSVLELGSSRTGLLTMLAVTLPMGLGAFLGLLSSVAGDWHASADLTAATTGVLAGLASVPGCLIGGYLCDRAPPQVVLACSGLACALGEAAMALGPRTPAAFVAYTLLNNLLLGAAWAAVAAVIFSALRRIGGGTVGSLLGSLCNVPVVLMTFVLASAQLRYGSTGMLTIEAGFGILSSLVYFLLAMSWRRNVAAELAVA